MPLPIYLKVVLVQLIIVLTLLPNTIVTHFLHDFFEETSFACDSNESEIFC